MINMYYVFTILGVPLGAVLALFFVIWFFVRNPDKFKEWVGIILNLFSFLKKNLEYYGIKYETEGKINSYVASLEKKMGVTFPKISIRWAAVGDKEELIFDDYEAILVVRDKKFKSRNFVNAAYFFTSEVMLGRAKNKVSKTQKTSLDLYATNVLLEEESKVSLEQFVQDFLSPAIEKNDEVADYIRKFIKIHQYGIFFPILIKELTNLGKKAFLIKKNDELIKDVCGLIDFLEKMSEREVGQDCQEEFFGNFINCSVKIVATKITIELGKVDEQKRRIVHAFKIGCENVYLLSGATRSNLDFINKVVKGCVGDRASIQVVKTTLFNGFIKNFDGRKIEVSTNFVHLHDPLNARVLITK